jgi:acyl-CoA synthetase (NDP forming)
MDLLNLPEKAHKSGLPDASLAGTPPRSMAFGQGSDFELLLAPRTVAIIGASNNPDHLAGLPIKYLKKAGFQGSIWPVNPNRETVQGLKSYASIADLPSPPDTAIIVVPAALVTQATRECAERGVKFAMIFSAGFGEDGDAEGQAELVEIARRAGMRLLGPNCLGCFSSESSFYGTFAIALEAGFHTPGNVAMVSQSGAYGEQTCYLARERRIGVRYFVSTGNEADIEIGELIDWLAGRDEIDVILAYLEGVRDSASLVRGLAHAQARGKKVILVKVGRSATGAAAAASHTAALAGDDVVWDALLRKYNVYRARSTEEQVDVAYAASRGVLPAGRRLGILSVSGGFGIQLCDAAEELGLEVTPLPAATKARLAELLPYGSMENPVDASGKATGEPHRIGQSLQVLAQDCGYDAVVGFIGTLPLVPAIGKPIEEWLTSAREEFAGRLVALCLIADPETVRAYEAAGFLVFPDAYRTIRAIAALTALSGHGTDGREQQVAHDGPATDQPASTALSEHAAKQYLEQTGVPILAERLATSGEDAARAASELGFPVVLKVCGPGILHKSEIGGVLLNVPSAQAAAEGFDLLIERATAAGHPRETLEGVIVAPMARAGIETILGVKNDPSFGPVVLFGMGGIYSEVLKDFAVRVAPIGIEEACEMVGSIHAWPLLKGIRGESPADIAVLAQAISDLSAFAAQNADRISEIDINPFVVWKEGEGAAALDALITLKPAD